MNKLSRNKIRYGYKFLWIILILLVSNGFTENESDIFLFSYFTDNSQNGLHLAYSKDGLKSQLE